MTILVILGVLVLTTVIGYLVGPDSRDPDFSLTRRPRDGGAGRGQHWAARHALSSGTRQGDSALVLSARKPPPDRPGPAGRGGTGVSR